MSGHIKGYVNGIVEGEFTGVIDGEMGAVVRARDTVEQLRENVPEQEAPLGLEAVDEAEGEDMGIASDEEEKAQGTPEDSPGMSEDRAANGFPDRTESGEETESTESACAQGEDGRDSGGWPDSEPTESAHAQREHGKEAADHEA